MKFKKGDRVRFVDEVGEGLVIAVKGAQIFVRDEHGFVMEMTENQIILSRPEIEKLHFENDHDTYSSLDTAALMGDEADQAGLKKYRKKNATKNVYLEIDLHIHELVDDSRHLSNFEIVTIQLNAFKKNLALAQKNHYQKVVFIHGVGEGVLRFEIRNILSGMSNCEFGDADYARYGQGATAVNLWYN